MSEYQSYEFVALDRALTQREMFKLRDISSRADITPNRFFNEYHHGDLNADPADILARFFDAHLHFALWGTCWFMMRVPEKAVQLKTLRLYAGRDAIKRRGEFLTVRIGRDDDECSDGPMAEPDIDALVPLRHELLCGDMRGLFLFWLARLQRGQLEIRGEVPEIPSGLAELTQAQRALADMLEIDGALLHVASGYSASRYREQVAYRRWVKKMPARDMTRLLVRASGNEHVSVQAELRSQFARVMRTLHPPEPVLIASLVAVARDQDPRGLPASLDEWLEDEMRALD